MTNLTKKITSVVATGAVLLSTSLPVFGVTIELTGNGVDSQNTANVAVDNTTAVTQVNDANITNNVTVSSSTGSNDANRNTSGDVSISTGNSGAVVAVDNSANTNVANVEGCCAADVDVLISENGDSTKNSVNLGVNQEATNIVSQINDARLENNVDVTTKTGYNDANRNTGGDVEIFTGDAMSATEIKNALNSNSAMIGGGSEGSSVSARILGNGVESQNAINLLMGSGNFITQINDANVTNNVSTYAKSGGNDANRNTGGAVSIDTGDALVDVAIDNMANFNAADVDCGCVMDVLAKISGNGDSSKNRITADLGSYDVVTQTNLVASGRLDNNVDVFAKTGYNDANRNTGEAGDDPSVSTGNSTVLVDLANSANTNVYGNGFGWDWPDMPEMPDWGDYEFQFGFNYAAMWAWMNMWMN